MATFNQYLFLATICHEIRSPLNGIIGYAQLLRETDLSSVQKKYLKSLNDCSVQLMKIVNDIMDFSKLASGNMNINYECVKVNNIIKIVTELLSSAINEKNQKLNFNVSENVPKFITTDKQKLIQVLVNLLSNASNYSKPYSEIHVRISIDDLLNNLVVEVEDQGIGISKEEQKKLFDIFVQVSNSTAKNGTGLGLAISKRIVNLLNGNISVRSKLGKGTTFTFTIDLSNSCRNLTSYNSLVNKAVLFFDNDTENKINISQYLLSLKMNTVVTLSIEETLIWIQSEQFKFDIVIIGTKSMTNLDLDFLTKYIKEKRPFLPIIVMTSDDTFVPSVNIDDKIDYPLNEDQLLSTLKKFLFTNTNLYSDMRLNTVPLTNSVDKTVKILISEDLEYNRLLLCEMLKKLNFTNVDTASNGRETIGKIQVNNMNKTPYKILLLDLRMPDVDGFHVIEFMKMKNYSLPTIVVITASVMEDDIIACKDKGIKYFLNKPIEINTLRDIMYILSSK